MRVLVTGGAGFVGSHVVDLLVEHGHEVVVIDSLIAHGGARPPWWRDDVEYHFGNIRDAEVWLAALPGVEAVSHQASRVGLGVRYADVVDYVADNDLGTAAGLLAMHELGFQGRMVLASSMVVYGEGRYDCPAHGTVRPPPRTTADLAAGRFDLLCPRCGSSLGWGVVDEDAPTDPRNNYAATKLHQEHLSLIFGREHGVAVTMLRYHNVIGPRSPQNASYAGVASIFAAAVERGEAPRVFEDGRQTRDFVHVLDVARANVLALTVDPPVEGPLNIASGHPRTISDMAYTVTADTGLTPVVVGGGRVGDVRHIVASPARAARLLGFQAELTPVAAAP